MARAGATVILLGAMLAGIALFSAPRLSAPEHRAGAGAAAEIVTGTTGARAVARRIISLSPALTRIAADLGVQAEIVGRTPWCTAAPSTAVVAGDLLHVDLEQVIRLRPTHILRQAAAAGDDAALLDVAQRCGASLLVLRGVDRLTDVERAIDAVADALATDDTRARLQARAAMLRERVRAALRPAPHGFRGPVLLVHGVDPVTVSGRETFLGDLLEALGGTNAAPLSGWGAMTLEDLVRLDPEAIVLVAPGDPMAMDRLAPLRRLGLAAFDSGRIDVLTAPDAMLPSTALDATAIELGLILARLARRGITGDST